MYRSPVQVKRGVILHLSILALVFTKRLTEAWLGLALALAAFASTHRETEAGAGDVAKSLF